MAIGISPVRIANLALSHVGAKSSIESLDEASPAARTCKLWFDVARAEVLEDHNWGYARRRAALALIENDPTPLWGYRFAYPAQCVKVREIENPVGPTGDAVPYSISDDGDETTILVNLQTPVAIFTRDVPDTTRWPIKAAVALSWKLAHRIAFTITGKTSEEDRCARGYAIALREAATSDASEGQDAPPREAEWIRGRD